jgi:endonuclease/exonuclease/phosphatase (EEP) superfamily protein YafD
VAAWLAAADIAIGGACTLLAGAGYFFDLVANLAAQGLLAGLTVCLVLAAMKQWKPLGLAGAGCLPMAWVLMLPLRTLSAESLPAEDRVSVLVLNSSTTRGDAAAAMALIEGTGADLVVLTEPSGELLDAVRASPAIESKYPGYFLPDRAAGGYILVLSIWPQSPVLGQAPKDIARRGLRVIRLERPRGPFVLMAMHPDSPRSPSEWAKGNQVVEEALGLLGQSPIQPEMPVIIAADLNATPSGWRSRRLEAAGLRRAKPLLAVGGTYPAGWPWPFSVAIDDVWAGAGCTVHDWRRLEGGGSDHVAILIELGIAGQSPVPAGR